MKRVILVLLNILALSNAAVYTECTRPGIAAITFDDGPDPTNTPGLLTTFREWGHKTTFFLNGLKEWHNETWYRETVLRAFNEGHSIGSHSWSHLDMTTLTADQIREELRTVHNIIYGITGKNTTIFRPPYGSYNDLVREIAEDEFGYDLIIWNVATEDYAHPDDPGSGVQHWKDVVFTDQYSSYIGLHHDWPASALDLAVLTMEFLREQGIQMVTIDDCIGNGKVKIIS